MRRRSSVLLVFALMASLLPALAIPVAAQPAAGDIFISEFHYDNASTDVGEFVEVTAPAGTDLTGYLIQPYNGSNSLTYTPTATLSGTVADQGSGYGTATADLVLQNGSPDGIALVDPAGELVEFISYEGTIVGANGPAEGVTSTDVGVAQPSNAVVGSSIERIGVVPGSWEWVSNDTNSKGELNAGLTIEGGDAPENRAIVASCDAVAFDEGQTGTADVSGRDADGTVTSAELTTSQDGITLTDVTPATEVGGTLTATVRADETLTVGEYTATVEFTNDDAGEDGPQTASCDVTITVRPDPCDDPTLISDINTVGSNGLPNTSKWNQRLGVEAIVTADFHDGLSGFFVQEEDADADGDESTSEGIFIYAPAEEGAPPVGSLVCVVGTVRSFSGTYQLTNVRIEVLDSDQPLPTAVQVKLPVGDHVELARIAGMRTELTGQDGTLTIAQNYFQGQYGELDLSGAGRLWNPTELYHPDDPRAAELRASNRLSLIKLDDANSTRNATPTPWIDNGSTRAGAETFEPIEGIVHYQFGSFRIQPTAPDDITFTNTDNPRPADAPDVSPAQGDVRHEVTVASFNVLNYFTTLRSEDRDARGADTTEEFELQAAKIVTAITKMDADVVGLMEIENNFGEDGDALADLVTRLNAVAGEGTYAAIALDEPVGTDAISNAMIYKPATVTPVGDPAIADHDAFVNPLGADTPKNRPAIAQAFESPTGEVFVVVVNHLKSKGSSCADEGDPGSDLTGNCNLTRTLAAEELVRWLEEDDPTGTGSDQVAVIGDLNAYAMEDPIDVLRDAGYVDALADQLGEAYSYVFNGELGRLDHGFISSTLTDNLVAADEWHINADEPSAFDYNDWNDPAVQDTSEFRSSDHDPMLIGLAFDCRGGGWASATPPRFANQGQCMAAVVAEGEGGTKGGGKKQR